MISTALLKFLFFFFNDTAPTEIYTFPYTTLFRSLIFLCASTLGTAQILLNSTTPRFATGLANSRDRKSTRLNSSHMSISYAVFCLKKKNRLIATPYGVVAPKPCNVNLPSHFALFL